MASVTATELPEHSLLQAYRENGSFTDCYSTAIPFRVSQEQFIYSFYTSWLFSIERFLLGWLAGYPASDADASALASAGTERFSAWVVEARSEHQLLMSDVRQRTRSWLMVQASGADTILYFGSAVVLVENPRTGKRHMGWLFSAFSGFHRLYSVLLLKVAVRRLARLYSPSRRASGK